MNASGSVSKLKRPMTKLCLVILSFAKNLNTSTLCFQILHFIQNDNNTRLVKSLPVIINIYEFINIPHFA